MHESGRTRVKTRYQKLELKQGLAQLPMTLKYSSTLPFLK